ncbi:MAG: DUF4381 domain-containing protein [Magnetococcales bacterium]|nr:DUF4381 domain-containing protein [Magnetococcales bacterium]
MNESDPLAGLQGLHTPPPIPLWPPAPGWWLLLGLLLLTGVATWGWLAWQRKKRQDPQRAALVELAAIEAQFRNNGDATALAVGISALLKRCAMIRHARQEVASLSGESWLQFLDTTGHCTAFTRGAGRVLATAPYQPGVAVDPEPLLAAARAWVQQAGGRMGV